MREIIVKVDFIDLDLSLYSSSSIYSTKSTCMYEMQNVILRVTKPRLGPKNLLLPACRQENFSHSWSGADRSKQSFPSGG